MSYINSYIQESNAADEILMEARTASPSKAGLARRPSRESGFSLDAIDPKDIVIGYMSFLKDTFSGKDAINELKEYLGEETEEEPEVTRPKAREDFYESTGLTEDPEFMAQLERMKAKYPGLTEVDIFKVIQKESGFDPTSTNKYKAAGLFQFIPKVSAEYGFTTEDIIGMEPAEQLKVYEMYLDRWKYTGNTPLGIMQAAPAFANASENTVVYKKGSEEWKANPAWRPSDGGDITVRSINNFYGLTR